MRERGFVLPHEFPATLWAWLNTTTGRRVGYVTYKQPTALGVLPMIHTVAESYLRRRYTDGEVPPC